MNPNVIQTWIVKGLGGIITILSQWSSEDEPLSPGHYRELLDLHDKLRDVLHRLRPKE